MEFELNNQYIAKDQFGFEISYKYRHIIIHLEIYDKNKRNEIIDIFRNFAYHLLKENKERGIERVFLVDAEDVKKQLTLGKVNIEKRKDFTIETADLLTGEFVPLFSKIIEKDKV